MRSSDRAFEQKAAKFAARAVRELERHESLPRGWVGGWRDACSPGGYRVHFSAGAWTLSFRGGRVSRHESRAGALLKAKKLAGRK
jgi:hypothetical protein